MFANPRQLMGGETLKPKKTSETLRRFFRYVRPWWPMMVVAIVCVVHCHMGTGDQPGAYRAAGGLLPHCSHRRKRFSRISPRLARWLTHLKPTAG